jgi:hypothetical protein
MILLNSKWVDELAYASVIREITTFRRPAAWL